MGAEPISGQYEQHRWHHVRGVGRLEDQMTGWVPGSGGDSPDRVDALVHAATELTTGGGVITASTPPATPLPGTSSPAGWGMMPGLGMPGGVQATPALDDLRRGRRR